MDHKINPTDRWSNISAAAPIKRVDRRQESPNRHLNDKRPARQKQSPKKRRGSKTSETDNAPQRPAECAEANQQHAQDDPSTESRPQTGSCIDIRI